MDGTPGPRGRGTVQAGPGVRVKRPPKVEKLHQRRATPLHISTGAMANVTALKPKAVVETRNADRASSTPTEMHTRKSSRLQRSAFAAFERPWSACRSSPTHPHHHGATEQQIATDSLANARLIRAFSRFPRRTPGDGRGPARERTRRREQPTRQPRRRYPQRRTSMAPWRPDSGRKAERRSPT